MGPASLSQPAPCTDVEDDLIVAPSQPRIGQMLIRVFGEIDLLNVERFESVLDQAVRAVAAETGRVGAAGKTGDEAMVVCDLHGVEFLGASGLAALLRIMATATDHEVGLAVVATGRVRHVFELTALDRVLPLTAVSPLPGAVPGAQTLATAGGR